jgi:bifunctional ADP-heptose synthase (sugar kinase/adenylyltransferase)
MNNFKFGITNILVIGDLMIDHYLWGKCERISPEAPVQVVNVQKESSALGGKLGDKLGETQQNIIKLMQNNPKIAITALAAELGISTTAIEKHIKTLKEQNIIQRIGGAKGGHWEILK